MIRISLAIIDTLERLALSILSQLVDAVVPPSLAVAPGAQPKQSLWKPKPVVVVLAKRGGMDS